jgi:hypothetical protein
MTRRSKRELERAVEDLDPVDDYDGPTEILITHHEVPTDWGDEARDVDVGEGPIVSQERIWRDETGEWHNETVAHGRDADG